MSETNTSNVAENLLITLLCCLFNPFFFHTFCGSPSLPSSSSTSVSSTNAPGGSGGSSGSSNTPFFSFFFSGGGPPSASASISLKASSSSSCRCSSISLSSLSRLLSPLFGMPGGLLTLGLSISPSATAGGAQDRSAVGVAKGSSFLRSSSFRFRGVRKGKSSLWLLAMEAGDAETRSRPSNFFLVGVAWIERGGVLSTSMKESKIPRTRPVFWGVGPT
jgi:hypothetical protein